MAILQKFLLVETFLRILPNLSGSLPSLEMMILNSRLGILSLKVTYISIWACLLTHGLCPSPFFFPSGSPTFVDFGTISFWAPHYGILHQILFSTMFLIRLGVPIGLFQCPGQLTSQVWKFHICILGLMALIFKPSCPSR